MFKFIFDQDNRVSECYSEIGGTKITIKTWNPPIEKNKAMSELSISSSELIGSEEEKAVKPVDSTEAKKKFRERAFLKPVNPSVVVSADKKDRYKGLTFVTEQLNDPSFDSESGKYVMSFGKHKGTAFASIPTSYLSWLFNEFSQGKFEARSQETGKVIAYAMKRLSISVEDL